MNIPRLVLISDEQLREGLLVVGCVCVCVCVCGGGGGGGGVTQERSGYALSHWEKALHSNTSSHWLSPYTEWSLCVSVVWVWPTSLLLSLQFYMQTRVISDRIVGSLLHCTSPPVCRHHSTNGQTSDVVWLTVKPACSSLMSTKSRFIAGSMSGHNRAKRKLDTAQQLYLWDLNKSGLDSKGRPGHTAFENVIISAFINVSDFLWGV